MTEVASPKVRFLVDDSVRPDLVQVLEEHGAAVVSSGKVEDPGRFAFDFSTVATVVTIAQTLLFNGAIIPAIYHRLHRHGGEQKLIVEGPFGRVELGKGGEALSPEGIKAAIELVVGETKQTS